MSIEAAETWLRISLQRAVRLESTWGRLWMFEVKVKAEESRCSIVQVRYLIQRRASLTIGEVNPLRAQKVKAQEEVVSRSRRVKSSKSLKIGNTCFYP